MSKELLQKLSEAFAGESQARNRYSFYAKVAKKEGFEQIASLFLLTADNEKQHAKWFFRMANEVRDKLGEETPVELSTGVCLSSGDTVANLKASIAGEHHEHDEMYPAIAMMAEELGFLDMAKRIRAIAKAELHHEERFKKLLANVEASTVFSKEEKTYWLCRECGYIHEGNEAPDECPSCDHPKAYFEVQEEKY